MGRRFRSAIIMEKSKKWDIAYAVSCFGLGREYERESFIG